MTHQDKYRNAVSNRTLLTIDGVALVVILASIVAVALMMGACQSPQQRPVAPSAHSVSAAPVLKPAPVRTLPARTVCPLVYDESAAWSGVVHRCEQAWPVHPSQVALCMLHYGPDAVGEDRLASQATRREHSDECLSTVQDGIFPSMYSELSPSALHWTANGITLGVGGCGLNLRGIDAGPISC